MVPAEMANQAGKGGLVTARRGWVCGLLLVALLPEMGYWLSDWRSVSA